MTKAAAKVWTVDRYIDQIVMRKVDDLERAENHPFFPQTFYKFESRAEALSFCVQRAERAVVTTKKDLDSTWRRLKRLRKMQAEAVR